MGTTSAQIRLTGDQRKALFAAIRDAYHSYDTLKMCLLYEMNVRAGDFVREMVPLLQQISDVMDWAESRDRVKELIQALRANGWGNPNNQLLKRVAEELLPVDDLEKIVSTNPELFSDPDRWRQMMVTAEQAVCRVENPEGRAWGTGFLVAPSIVMTNHHVKKEDAGRFESSPASVRFRFGSRVLASGVAEGGVVYGLDAAGGLQRGWFVWESETDKLDYAIVRLDKPAGNETVGQFVGAPQRGWLSLKKHEVKINQALFILQHPLGDVLKLAPGGLKRQDPVWLDYEVDTEPGSSGSPVFNNLWQLIGLHSRAGTAQVNRGIAVSAILNDLPSRVKNQLGGED